MCALLLMCVAAGCGAVGILRLEGTLVINESSVVSAIACLLSLHGAWLAALLSRSGALKPKVPRVGGVDLPEVHMPEEEVERLTLNVSLASPGTNQLVAIRYPGLCTGGGYEADYAAACDTIRAIRSEYALLHDFRQLSYVDPWALLKDAISIARAAKIAKVGFVFADFGGRTNAVIRWTIASFCPVKPARVFCDAQAARAWCLEPERTSRSE